MMNQRGFIRPAIGTETSFYGTVMNYTRRLDRRAALRKNRRSAVREQIRRALKTERLEERSLLAADFMSSYYNVSRPTDVDADGYTAPNDALTIINSLNAHGSYELPQGVEGEAGSIDFVDVDNDGFISPADALTVINWLNAEGAPPDQDDRALYELIAVKPGTSPSSAANRITSVQVGQDFDLIIQVSDLRDDGNENRGLFSAYLELGFDETFAMPRVAEVQQITLANVPSGGAATVTFTVTIPAFGSNPGGTTADISYTGTATQNDQPNRQAVATAIQSAINTTLGGNIVLVTPIGTSGFNYSIWFTGAFDVNVPKLSATRTSTVGGAITVRDASDNTAQSSFRNVDGDITIADSFIEAFRSRAINVTSTPGPYQERGSAENELAASNLVDELGFFTSSLDPLGNFPFEVVRVRMKAALPGNQTSGQVTFTPFFGLANVPPPPNSDAHDSIDRPAHNTLEYADVGANPPENQFVDPSQIAFNVLTLQINTGPITANSFNVSATEGQQNLIINPLNNVTDNPGAPDNPTLQLFSIGAVSPA